jgi:hypothetical protein
MATSLRIQKTYLNGVFDITVQEADDQLARRIQDVVGEEIGLLPVFQTPEDGYVDVKNMPNYQHAALFKAAALYFAADPNKISTIKFIRSITNTAPLLEAKQLVDYALGGVKPTWFKDEYTFGDRSQS